MGFLKSLILMLLIPLFGYLVSEWVLSDLNDVLSEKGITDTLYQLCSTESISQTPTLKPICEEISPYLWLKTGSMISAIVTVILLLSFKLLALIAGKSRFRITLIFPPLVFIALIVLAGQVVVQGVILTYGAYVAESYAINRVHFILIGGIGLGAFLGALSIMTATSKLIKKQSHFAKGNEIDLQTHPKLFSLIEEVSATLGAKKPAHVVLGLEPNFYVTSADVNIPGNNSVLSGGTLYLSLPLSRILTLTEMKAIIGHELGHFRGEDTYYSLKFAPVYSSLSHAITAIDIDESEGGVSTIARIPAIAVLSYMIDVFHKNVSIINRDREYEADIAASEVVDPKALASSLLKISLYANAWNDLNKRVIERMQEGKITRNLSRLFASIVKYDVNKESIPKVLKSISQQTIFHPTDSHPPTANRINALGIKIDDIDSDLLIMPDNTCIELFENPLQIEEELTVFQQVYYKTLGVDLPDEGNTNFGATIIAALGAQMVVADGKIELEEIEEAESFGITMSKEFDTIEFREYCLYPDSIPSIEELLEASKDIPIEVKSVIYNYLEQIAGSDNEVSKEEKELLDRVGASFGI